MNSKVLSATIFIEVEQEPGLAGGIERVFQRWNDIRELSVLEGNQFGAEHRVGREEGLYGQQFIPAKLLSYMAGIEFEGFI